MINLKTRTLLGRLPRIITLHRRYMKMDIRRTRMMKVLMSSAIREVGLFRCQSRGRGIGEGRSLSIQGNDIIIRVSVTSGNCIGVKMSNE
jgi:hypothetical protein